MKLICHNLFIGKVGDSETFGQTAGVVVNCTTDLPFLGDPAHQTQIRVPVKDNGDDAQQDALLRHLLDLQVCARIDDALRQGSTVLVHCRAGQQRSAAVVAAFLMHTQDLTAAQAVRLVRSRSPDAFFGAVNFHRTLDALERLL
jgi:rhodanese-related sulfurtransferase